MRRLAIVSLVIVLVTVSFVAVVPSNASTNRFPTAHVAAAGSNGMGSKTRPGPAPLAVPPSILLRSVNRSANFNEAINASAVVDILGLGLKPAAPVVGDLGDGRNQTTVGVTNFTSSASDADFPYIAAVLADGVDDAISFSEGFPNNPAVTYAGSESYYLGGNPDLLGYKVDFIRLVITRLQITTSSTLSSASEDYSWEFWGHRIFVAFAPPTDANGTYLVDRRYTNVSVTLESPATAVLEWNGANRTMVAAPGNTAWSLNLTGLANGLYPYRVWATGGSGTFVSETRVLTVGVGIWTIFPVASGSLPSVAIDSRGDLHLCLYGGSNGPMTGLVYGVHTVLGWSFTDLESTTGYTGQGCSIAIDSQGFPHISFLEGPVFNGTLDVAYASYDGSKWTVPAVSYGLFTYTYLALDPVSGLPSIAHSNPKSGGGLYLASFDGTRWSDRAVNTSFNGYAFSLAIGPDRRPQIVYADYRGGVTYARWNGTNWSATLLNGNAYAPSLAVDAGSHPHIAYISANFLRYATFSGTAWTTETVDYGGSATSLVLDAQGRPRIAYGPGWQNDVRYAVLNGTWSIQVVSDHAYGNGVALAVLPTGEAGIFYQASNANQDLVFGTNMNFAGIPPVAAFTASPSVVAGVPAFFNSSSHGPRGWGLASALWNFGDGSVLASLAAQVTHTYMTAGTFTVNLTVTDLWGHSANASAMITVTPPPPLGLVVYDSPNGFRIPVPDGWTRTYNVTQGQNTYELVLQGAVGAQPANMIVASGADSSLQETDAYMSIAVRGILQGVQQQFPDAYLAAPMKTFPVSGHLGATFEIGYTAHPVVQFALIVVSAAHGRFWTALLTGPTASTPLLASTFAAIVAGFVITAPAPIPVWLIAALAGAAIGAVGATVFFVVRQRRRAQHRTQAAVLTCARCGGGLQPADTICPRCGAPIGGGPPP